MPTTFRNGILAIISGISLVLICYQWIDKPVAYWSYAYHLNQFFIFKWLTHIPEAFIASMGIIYPLLIIRFCYSKWTHYDKILLAAGNSLAIAYFVHGPLKFVFGRYWPLTWVNNNPSLLRDNAYGFNCFHHGVAYESFPSGHETATVAVLTILWIAFPSLRWLAILLSVLVAVGLLGMNYHFVGDIIAGGFLGALTAYYTAKISGIEAVNNLAWVSNRSLAWVTNEK